MINNIVIGKRKDECAGRQVSEYVRFRPKMYCVLEDSGSNIKKSKGWKKMLWKKIKFGMKSMQRFYLNVGI